MKNKKLLWLWIPAGILWLIAGMLFICTRWYSNLYKLSFREFLYTMTSPLQGTGAGIVQQVLASCLPGTIGVFLIFICLAILLHCKPVSHLATKHPALRIFLLWGKRCLLIGSVFFAIAATIYFWIRMDVADYIKSVRQTTRIYEDHYIAPSADLLIPPAEKKNLLCIYLESMEMTYASADEGGIQSVNLIPGMTDLAKQNLSFSDKPGGKLGGYYNVAGTGWTVASLLASTGGVPFSFPVDGNSMNRYESFAPNLVTLGDLLDEQGYRQEFLCGSEASYAGRSTYFRQHGNHEIFDLFTAREKGYIPSDYYVWWGYEDHILYQIAQDELTRLSASDQPFHLTMLTVDPHHLNGFVCAECSDTYEDSTANVIACADRLLSRFLAWCREQSWYQDTVIMILGDHPRMDIALVGDLPYESRTPYNCLINSQTSVLGNTEERLFTPMDMFPTILEALGWHIEGDRLGLGTGLFSGTPTLAEEFGLEWLSEECGKTAPGFIRMFCGKAE